MQVVCIWASFESDLYVTKFSASKFLDVKWIRVSNYNTKPLSTQIRMFTIQISIVLSEDVELSCLVDFSSPYSAIRIISNKMIVKNNSRKRDVTKTKWDGL